MPKRTATINRSEDKSVKDDNTEIEHIDDESQDVEEPNMLDLDNLRDLIFLGKLNEVVEISGYKFVVTTLSVKQHRDIMEHIMSTDQNARLLDIKPLTVSFIIETINNVPLEDLCEDDDIENPMLRRLSVVMNMQSNIVEKVYQVYEQLLETSNKNIGLENLKE